jgi:uncharacterized membrane protein YadS
LIVKLDHYDKNNSFEQLFIKDILQSRKIQSKDTTMPQAYTLTKAIECWSKRAWEILPGLALSVGVAGLAVLAAKSEIKIFGAPWLEPLVLAILIGAILRTLWQPDGRFLAGIGFATKTLLEIAIVLLGATVSAQPLLSVGPKLLVGIISVVVLVVPGSYFLGYFWGCLREWPC